MSETMNSKKRVITGRVISNRANKTVTVLVERRVRHAVYGKIVMRSTKYHAHDELNSAKIGDLVTIQECRPISKTKCWKLVNVE